MSCSRVATTNLRRTGARTAERYGLSGRTGGIRRLFPTTCFECRATYQPEVGGYPESVQSRSAELIAYVVRNNKPFQEIPDR